MPTPPLVTPNSEWASSSLSALGPVSHVEDQIDSNLSTPGLHVPGAFPLPHNKDAAIREDTPYFTDAAIGALQTAKAYVPASVEEVKRLIGNAGDTVGGYLPESVAAYLPRQTTADTSLPSEPNPQNVQLSSSGEGTVSSPNAHTATNTSLTSERTSQNVHPDSSSGAGTLLDPFKQGTATDTSVHSEDISQNIPPDSSSGAGSLSAPPGEFGLAIPSGKRISSPSEYTSSSHNHGPNSETLRTETGFAILPEERRQQHLPSHDDDPLFATEMGKSLSTGGVGALPGDKEEFGVARLPEERQAPVGPECGASADVSTRELRGTPSTNVQDGDISQYTLPAAGFPPLSPLPISASNKTTADSSTHASHPTIPNATAKTYALASDGIKFKGVPSSKGFQKELDEEQSSSTEKFISERQNLKQGQGNVATSGNGTVGTVAVLSDSHTVYETARKKPGFMDKLKGEVKIISGKLSHKESKVEEGKKMMGKT